MAARLKISSYKRPSKTKRPGVHSKSKTSHLKSSKNYKKKYRGQGRSNITKRKERKRVKKKEKKKAPRKTNISIYLIQLYDYRSLVIFKVDLLLLFCKYIFFN